jgi:hypothetical protein
MVCLGRRVGLVERGRPIGVVDLDGEAVPTGDFGRMEGDIVGWVVDRGNGCLRGETISAGLN